MRWFPYAVAACLLVVSIGLLLAARDMRAPLKDVVEPLCPASTVPVPGHTPPCYDRFGGRWVEEVQP